MSATSQIAHNGAAIINTSVVPPAEVRVLFALISLKEPAIVAQVAKQATAFDPSQPMSDPSVASLLTRLSKRDALVTRETKQVPLVAAGIGTIGHVKRVLWTPSTGAVEFFNQLCVQQKAMPASPVAAYLAPAA